MCSSSNRVIAWLLTILSVTVPLCVIGCDDSRRVEQKAEPDIPPVTLTDLKTGTGKGGCHWCNVTLVVENSHRRPVWFVFPPNASIRFTKQPVFVAQDDSAQPFSALQCVSSAGKNVQVCMSGRGGFKAFHVPGQGRFVLQHFAFDCDERPFEIDVLETTALLVNGETPLEKWLPYATLCDPRCSITYADWENLDWDPQLLRPRVDYPKKKVVNVKPVRARCYALQPTVGRKCDPNE